MRKTLLASSILLLLSACQEAPPGGAAPVEPASHEATTQQQDQQELEQAQRDAAETESARLNQWLEDKYEEHLERSPIMQTFLGRKDNNDQIDQMTVAEEQARFELLEASVNELRSEFDYDQLNSEAQASYDLWIFQYEQEKAGIPFRESGYVFDQMRGAHSFLPQILLAYHSVDDEADMVAYISRIEGISRALQQLTERAQAQAGQGIRPPLFAYDYVLQQSKALIDGAPLVSDADTDIPVYSDALSKIEALEESGDIEQERADELREATRQALTEHFAPAYQALIDWLESDREHAEENTVGISRHDGGDDYYEYLLQVFTTTDLTAEAVHQIGLDEVERISAEMEAIKEQVGFDGDLQAFFQFIRTDERFFYPNTDEGREAFLEDSRAYLDAIDDKLPEFFGRLPKADLVVRRVEAYREQDGAPQHYYPGAPDGSRPGIYYAHLSDMSALQKNEMEAIAYHEGNPGHHMQISIAQELDDMPLFRTQSRLSVYTEGWALYSELLAKEMGGYEDPYSDFGRLVTEIWRAIRLVVDTGLHAKGWTEEEAVAYFQQYSPVAESAIRSEVQRYLVMPGQATSYKIGMLKIQELRAYAEEELADSFDIREFHDVVLGGGALPLPLLERRVTQWVENQLN